MKLTVYGIIQTLPSKLVGTYRVLLGLIFITVGGLKYFNSTFGTIWNIQLQEIRIPFIDFFYYFVPFYEIVTGCLLLVGYFTRVGAVMIIPVMFVAIYTHLSVYDPNAFFFHPYEAFYPSMVIMMAFVVLLYGGGRWSLDLKIQKKHFGGHGSDLF